MQRARSHRPPSAATPSSGASATVSHRRCTSTCRATSPAIFVLRGKVANCLRSLRRGRDSNPSSGVDETFRRYATLRANAARQIEKMGRTALSAGDRGSTGVDRGWATGGQRRGRGLLVAEAFGGWPRLVFRRSTWKARPVHLTLRCEQTCAPSVADASPITVIVGYAIKPAGRGAELRAFCP